MSTFDMCVFLYYVSEYSWESIRGLHVGVFILHSILLYIIGMLEVYMLELDGIHNSSNQRFWNMCFRDNIKHETFE